MVIDNQTVLRSLMDKQFEDTFWFFSIQFMIYTIFYLLPMFVYFTVAEETWLLYPSFVVSVLLFIYDVI